MNWVTLSRILHFHTRLPYLWTHTYGHLVHYQVHADVLMAKPGMQAFLNHVPEAMFLLRQDTGVLVVMLNMHSYASVSQGDGKDLQPESSRAGRMVMASHLS